MGTCWPTGQPLFPVPQTAKGRKRKERGIQPRGATRRLCSARLGCSPVRFPAFFPRRRAFHFWSSAGRLTRPVQVVPPPRSSHVSHPYPTKPIHLSCREPSIAVRRPPFPPPLKFPYDGRPSRRRGGFSGGDRGGEVAPEVLPRVFGRGATSTNSAARRRPRVEKR